MVYSGLKGLEGDFEEGGERGKGKGEHSGFF